MGIFTCLLPRRSEKVTWEWDLENSKKSLVVTSLMDRKVVGRGTADHNMSWEYKDSYTLVISWL